jgi:putative cell wall-binding protein
MSKSPLWFRRLLVGGVSTLTVGGLGMTGLLATAGAASATSAFKITQLAGADRFATAAAIAAAAFPKGASTVVVASGLDTNLPDSLAASYLAAQQTNTFGGTGAPVLLVNTDSVPSATAAAIVSLNPTNIIIVGGTAAVTPGVEATLSNGGTIKVTRVAGANRFLTADAIDSQTGFEHVGTKKTAIVADGVDTNLVDALGASPLAGAGPYPMFLVNGPTGTLSSTDLSIMASDGITNAVIVGGSSAVGAAVSAQLTAKAITNVTEAGPDRSATSEVLANYEIANYGFSNTEFNIAGGGQPNLVDSLTGGPLGAAEPAPTLITDSPSNAASVVTFAAAHEPTEVSANLFGGSAGVDATAEAAIVAAANTPPTAPTNPPMLASASITGTTTSGTTVQYVFNESLTGDTLATSQDFHVYTNAATTTELSATGTLDGTNPDAVDVVYATLTTATEASTLALATVSSGAVTPPAPVPPATKVVGPNPDGAAPIGTGTVQSPLLTNVVITQVTPTPATYEGQYTFSEPVVTASIMPADFHLYDPDGTELTCTSAVPATTNGTTGPAVINCLVYVVGTTTTTASAAQVSLGTLGTVDHGAVTGAGSPDTTTNPEGAVGHF